MYKIITEGYKQWVVRPTTDVPAAHNYKYGSMDMDYVEALEAYGEHLSTLPRYLWLGPRLETDSIEEVRIGWQRLARLRGAMISQWINCSKDDYYHTVKDDRRLVAYPITPADTKEKGAVEVEGVNWERKFYDMLKKVHDECFTQNNEITDYMLDEVGDLLCDYDQSKMP